MQALSQALQFFRDPWNILGSIGQLLFASRFLIQWIKSEMAGKSIIPLAFWYCSLGGGLLLLAYAIYRDEPVFIAGQIPGIIVYSRNLFLISREKTRA
jgi:lipid-A-disaccharide synthase-like uncharacterized protein